MPDLPKYIGIQGSHTDFKTPAWAEPLMDLSSIVGGDDAKQVSANLNNEFADANEHWNPENGDHISDMYVRTRDVMPLLKLARTMSEEPAVFGANAALQDELVRCLDYLKDLE